MKLWLLLSLAVLAACHSESGFRRENAKVEEISEIPHEIRVPLKIWDALAEEEKGKGKKEEKKEEKEGDAGYVFSELKVFLTEKNPGVLKEPGFVLHLPRGGGEIDLSQYTGARAGSFYVGFEIPETQEKEIKKVLFISHSRKRKLDDQVYGSGCHEFYDVTKTFLKEMARDGLKVNTTRNRHVSVLGGTFILESKKGGQSYLTQVTFTDSGNKNLLCQESEWKKF